MTNSKIAQESKILVAVDVSKSKHDLLISQPGKRRRRMKIMNRLSGFNDLKDFLNEGQLPVKIGLEATGNYHRALAHFLKTNGYEVVLISSIALARTREALHNSWDKHDPKDAQVILYMLQNDITQFFYDPLIEGNQDWQEISKTYFQVSLRKTKLQHSILNHCLPLYFPEIEKYYHSSRAIWFTKTLLKFPCPAAITKLSEEKFIEEAWPIVGRKVNKTVFLKDIYDQAKNSIALPIKEDSDSISMFKTVLQDYLAICERRKEIEEFARNRVQSHPYYPILSSVPGVGPIVILTIIAEAGDLTRFDHHRQFLKYCGFDLATNQSGQYRGKSKLSKRGNARLRMIFWMAATIAIRQQENTFRTKFERYIRNDPKNSDLKRKAYTATAAKMARVVYGMVKNNVIYRPFFEDQRVSMPGGGISIRRAVGATRTP